MGDYADLITPNDPRWQYSSVAPWVKQEDIVPTEEQWIYELFLPIKGKCLGLIEGNHETYIRTRHRHDIVMHLCDRLGVKYLGYSSFVRLSFRRAKSSGRTEVICWFGHGSGGPQTDGGKINNLTRALRYFEADIWAKGHVHDIKIHEEPMLKMTHSDPPKIVETNRCAAITGTWFYSYRQGERPSYAEIKGYAPTRIGCPVFTITPDKHRINVYSHGEEQ